MFEIELKSKELTEYVYITVDKDRAEPLYDSDLEQVEDVTLDAFDFIGEPTDETIYDLVFFKNLKNCMIVNMTISAGEIEILNKLENLESIQFVNCVFKSDNKYHMKATEVILDKCIEANISLFDEMNTITKLKIVNCDKVNLKGLENLSNVTEIYLQNLILKDIDEVSKLKKLEYINLNGTKVENLTDIVNNPKISVDYEELNYIYDGEDN